MRAALRKNIRAALSLLLAAILFLTAGCGASGTQSAETPAPEPTEHVHRWKGGVCADCGELCAHVWEDGVCTVCGAVCAHRWTDGACTVCGAVCAHRWKGGLCTVCASRCPHGEWRDGVCPICGMRCAHRWENGICTICGESCAHRWLDGRCRVCGLACEHLWQDEVCTICGLGCEHLWQDGVCTICGAVCPHERHDAESCLCETCGTKVGHEYENGRCLYCGEEPPFVTKLLDLPAEIKPDTEEKGALESYHYSIGTGELLPGAHGTVTREERKLRDVVVYTPYGYDPEEQYNVLIIAPGAGHNAHQWMERANMLSTKFGRLRGCDFLDRLTAAGRMEPMIVAVVEYYLRGSPAEIAEIYEKDLRERVLPYLAAHYGTYASVDEEGNFVAAPEHFAFLGCSFGSMVGWHMLPYCTDLFAYWGLLSGAFQNTEEQEITEKINRWVNESRPIHYLYAGDGVQALGWAAYRNRMKKLGETAYPLETDANLKFLAVERVGHSYPAWDTGLYNCLQIFFRNRYVPEEELYVPPVEKQVS